MLRLILDVMGGDRGPLAVLEGLSKALPELLVFGEVKITLIGNETVLKPLLTKRRLRSVAEGISSGQISLLHSDQNIEMEDSIKAVRTKPNATINLGCQMAAKAYTEKTPAAFISAGHSGAMMGSALMHMGRLEGVERPAIAANLPTLSEDVGIILDVGANVDCKPENLRDFAVMGAIFAQVGRKNKNLPKIGLLSNGEERSKGNELTRAALPLIDQLSCFKPGPAQIATFVGYAEGKDFFKGQVDVVITDGFVGNLVLKSVEGVGSAVVSILKLEAKSGVLAPLGFLLAAGVFKRLIKKLDWAEYGAAPLLGVAGYAFICHGRSNSKAIKNALIRAAAALKSQVVENLEEALFETGLAARRPTKT